MGNFNPMCFFCSQPETEDNPLMKIYSRGKYGEKFICFNCIKRKIKIMNRYEQKLMER